MKIYDRQGTPNAARIRIVLAAKGLDDKKAAEIMTKGKEFARAP